MPKLTEKELSDPHFRGGFLHAMIWGTEWPSQEIVHNLHAIIVRSLEPETLDAYNSCSDWVPHGADRETPLGVEPETLSEEDDSGCEPEVL